MLLGQSVTVIAREVSTSVLLEVRLVVGGPLVCDVRLCAPLKLKLARAYCSEDAA
jgi:hypothetical protein